MNNVRSPRQLLADTGLLPDQFVADEATGTYSAVFNNGNEDYQKADLAVVIENALKGFGDFSLITTPHPAGAPADARVVSFRFVARDTP